MKHISASRYSLGIVLLGVAAPVAFVTTVIAQTPAGSAPAVAARPPALPAGAAGAQRYGDVYLKNSDKGKYVYDQQSGIHKITDNVRVYQDGEDFILYADELTYNEKTNEALATGNLRVETRDSTLTGKLIRANFDKKVIVVLGNVVMKSHGKDDGIKTPGVRRSIREELSNRASSMTCERLDYNYENREALASEKIRMRQGKNFGTCNQIFFDEENNIVQLRGDVSFTNDENQKIDCSDVTIWMNADRYATDNGVDVRIPSKQREKPDKTPKTKFPAAPKVPDEWLKELSQPVAPGPTPVPIGSSRPRPDNEPQLDTTPTPDEPTTNAEPTPANPTPSAPAPAE